MVVLQVKCIKKIEQTSSTALYIFADEEKPVFSFVCALNSFKEGEDYEIAIGPYPKSVNDYGVLI